MNGLISTVFVLITAINAHREPWIEPLPGVRIEATRAARLEEDFGPDSAYRLMLEAAELPPEAPTTRGWEQLLPRFREHPWPARPPEPFADDQAWPPQDYARIRAIVAVAQPNLQLAREAAAAQDQEVPTLQRLTDTVSYLAPARQVARLLQLSAHVQAGEGHAAEAFDDLFAAIRLGNILSRGGPSNSVCHMVDMAISNQSAEESWRIATQHDMPPTALKSAGQELLGIADKVEPFAEAMRGEARGALMSARSLHRSSLPGHGGRGAQVFVNWLKVQLMGLTMGSTPEAMERDFTYLFQHVVALAEKPYHAETKEQLDSLVGTGLLGHPMRDAWFRRDPVGLGLARMIMMANRSAFAKAAERDAILRGTALFLAIAAYETETGAPPKTLGNLVPDYLPRVPVDPFDGKPFRYRTKDIPAIWGNVTWGIYSIGSDFTDDGGDANRCVSTRYAKPKHGESPDIVWLPKPFPEPPPVQEPKPKRGLFE